MVVEYLIGAGAILAGAGWGAKQFYEGRMKYEGKALDKLQIALDSDHMREYLTHRKDLTLQLLEKIDQKNRTHPAHEQIESLVNNALGELPFPKNK